MGRKDICFFKNLFISNFAGVIGGVAGAEISDLFTNSETFISISSTATQGICSTSFLLPLHARDNKDLYRDENNKFKWGDFRRDVLKLGASFAVLDCFYYLGRPMVNSYFQKKGYEPWAASLLSDAVCKPIFWAVAVPLARRIGVVREKNDYK